MQDYEKLSLFDLGREYDLAALPPPWWKSDRTWAALLVVCTLALCWYFA